MKCVCTENAAILAAVSMLSALAMPGFAQSVSPDAVPVRNWSVATAKGAERSAPQASASGNSQLIFVAITPCRVLDTRGGSGKTGSFGPPSLSGGVARTIPVPATPCGVPVAAAYSMNFVSITPAGQSVGYIAAWQDDQAWPGTAILNALLGGVVDNAAVVPAGADGGIQVQSTNDGDLVIDMNGYYVQATGITGATGAQGPAGPQGPAGTQGPSGPQGPQGLTGVQGPLGMQGPMGVTGAIGPQGPPMAFRNAWGNTSAYAAGNTVSENGTSYIALAQNTGVDPATDVSGPGTTWAVLALKGSSGAAATVGVGTVTTGAAGTSASVTNSGSSGAAVFDFTIPRGPAGSNGVTRATGATGAEGVTGAQGPAGVPGPAGATGLQGPPVAFRNAWSGGTAYIIGDAVSENGTSYIALTANTAVDPAMDVSGSGGNWAVLALKGNIGAIGAPGAAGATGANGTNGTNGTNGAAATVGVGTVTTGAAGTSASVTNSGSSSAAVFNFTIPQGLVGAQGVQGPAGNTGAQGPAGATGTQGPAGATGAQGPAGATGAQGAAGNTGAQGPAGATGAQGPAGATGAQGPAGGFNGAYGVGGSTLGNGATIPDWGVNKSVVYFVNNSATVTLPLASTVGQVLIVNAASFAGTNITVARQGTDFIRDPLGNSDTRTNFACFTITLVSDGAGHWFVTTFF
jgi:hypothetical protein